MHPLEAAVTFERKSTMKSFIITFLLMNILHYTTASTPGNVHKITLADSVQLHAVEYPGEGTPFLLLHGFPDNKLIYHGLIAELQLLGRRCIVFDFVGWGDSDKPSTKDYPYSAATQAKEIAAVVAYFALERVSLVVHDMAGPPAIDFALAHKEQVEQMILLNTYYHSTKNRREPPTITLFSAPVLRQLCTPFGRLNPVFKPVFKAQMKPFFNDPAVYKTYVPLFLKQFLGKDHSKNPMLQVISQVPKVVKQNLVKIDQLKSFDRPVKIIFGASDQFLGSGLAREFQQIFPLATLHLIDQCNHYPQIEYPKQTAALMVENWAKDL